MSATLYITHPEVVIDPDVPMPQWGLSETGRRRAETFAKRGLLAPATHFFSSTERKAMELAEILARPCGGTVTSDARLCENDRSSTGYLMPEDFERHVEALFGQPDESINGWETARNAQSRIVGAVSNLLSEMPVEQDVVFTGHGCVGTLLKCHLGGRAIARHEDQRVVAHPGGGNLFAFDLAAKRLLCEFTPMENWQGLPNG